MDLPLVPATWLNPLRLALEIAATVAFAQKPVHALLGDRIGAQAG